MKKLKLLILTLGIGLIQTFSAFGAGTTISSIESVDNIDVLKTYELKIPDDAMIKRERSEKDFVGYAIKAFKVEKAYKDGKKELYISERFLKDEEDGKIKLFKTDYSGIVEEDSTWFMDVDGRWYAFSKGVLITNSPIYDKSRDTYYVLNPTESELGALIHSNGFYNINGKLHHLIFDNTHNGIFGACIYGIESIG